ncbi:glycosyltransferase family 39 protein [Cylindrobasidium torrendii FP15055 ss-10]|uniref:Dolichyl-phosphate-mannose--protein mannosyltransferase n=1 Tax=Cylindrobasidium torrendii FP15055 ss-10 TaxID=1314674 RepID=A0A0D7AYG7_9AGAR|nr:glycosyltransferase family 39 protein [Cylindrobasidium torrendii FP15055 ss-10]
MSISTTLKKTNLSATCTAILRGNSLDRIFETKKASMITVGVLTSLALVLRLARISKPEQVVFDEVHFGKFAAYYITNTYYFDVHPPLAKMLFGLAGWFTGFDGDFLFDNIGDSYTEHDVAYTGMRSFAAILGSLTVPIVYAIMKETGHPTVIAAFSAILILFDNAHIAQSRLILLDATLIFFLTLTIYCYIKFQKLRYWEFSWEWWKWLLLTGIFMACAWGSKVNGVLTVATIGIATLVDLWDLLDVRKGNTMEHFWRHFRARAIGLILVPFMLYLSFFYVHFKVLYQSGPGDTFMSPAFQETLYGNDLLLNSQEIRYYDTITMKHKDTKVLLHSHIDQYPLRYDDGRISSNGQQVTGYKYEDENNWWQVLPTKALPESGRGRIVRHDDVVQLLHVKTNTLLLTHDVASPLMPTNQEFTTASRDDLNKYNNTLFHLEILDANEGTPWKTKASYFRLIHVPTRVAMWTHNKLLPEWAYKQHEINGNKNPSEKTATWFADQIIMTDNGQDPLERTGPLFNKKPKSMNFFRKWVELQGLMMAHNAGLTASHPYASSPINWPFLISGISFWTQDEGQKQIYLIGNIVGWWICVLTLSIYVGVLAADLLARRRAQHPLDDAVRNRLWNSTGFFFIVWAVHYFPFFLMSRQLFIHHYLPSHVASALIAGSILNFVLSDTVDYPISKWNPKNPRSKKSVFADVGLKGPVVVLVVTGFMVWNYIFMIPLTYGVQGLTGEEVNSRRLLDTWTLHFAAKQTHDGVL